MLRRKFSKRHRTVVLLETYITGAFDFKEYVKHRHDVGWRIKYRLVTDRISSKLLSSALSVLPCINPDKHEDMFDMIMGSITPDSSTNHNQDIQHITAKTLFAMTDEQRQALYDKIVSSVLTKDTKTDK